MASISATLSTATLPELKFLCSNSASRSFRVPLSRFSSRRRSLIRIKAVNREESAVVEERDAELVRKVNGSVNGSVKKIDDLNGALLVEKYTNGSVGVSESENESLMKYVNGNGNGVAAKSRDEVVEVKAEEVVEKKEKKQSVEEIGQEEAWFKKNDQVEVYMLAILGYSFTSI